MVLPHCCCLRAKFWTQESSLGSGQNEERDENPAWCFTSSVHRPAAERTAQTKCLQVSQLKLLQIILFIKNISWRISYIYIFLWILLIDRNNKQTCDPPWLKKQRPILLHLQKAEAQLICHQYSITYLWNTAWPEAKLCPWSSALEFVVVVGGNCWYDQDSGYKTKCWAAQIITFKKESILGH